MDSLQVNMALDSYYIPAEFCTALAGILTQNRHLLAMLNLHVFKRRSASTPLLVLQLHLTMTLVSAIRRDNIEETRCCIKGFVHRIKICLTVTLIE